MTDISRRSLFKTAAAASAAAVLPPAAHAQQAPATVSNGHEGYGASEKSAALFEPSPLPASDLSLTGTYDLGKSTVNEGTSITASRWGIVRPYVKGGKIVAIKPFEHDYAPSPNLQGLAELPYSPARIRYPMVREGYL